MSMPPSIDPTLFKCDPIQLFTKPEFLSVLFVLFFYPLIKMIGGGYQTPQGNYLYPVIAPALIVVGSMMIFNVRKIKWEDPTEALPSFLTLAIMQIGRASCRER